MRSFISSRVSLTLVAATIVILVLVILPASAATMTGTSSDDNLVGTDGEDKMNGVAGSDQLDGRAQNDSLGGQEGADIINGGPGEDTLNGQGGSDHVRAAPNTDTQAMDSIDCGAGVDFLYIEGGYTGTAVNCEHRQRVSDWNTSKPSWPVKDPDGDGFPNDGHFADNCPNVANPEQDPEACGTPPPPTACADGVDNDGDTLIDMSDPGCTGSADTDEADSPPPPSDSDGDGVTDDVDACPSKAGPASNQGCPIVTPPPTGGHVAGAFIAGAPSTPSVIDDFNALVSSPTRLVMWYENWDSGFSSTRFEAAHSRGATPMVTWEPWNRSLSGMASGQYDAYIRAQAQTTAAYGKRVYIRPMHEMNGDWYPWSVGVNGDTAATYVSAWRRIHTIFDQEGATNVRWVWSPNVDLKFSELPAMYPGDAFVDVIGMDGYNWGPTQGWSSWQSMGQVFKRTYDSIGAWNATKPMMLAETASTETGGDKAAWIKNGYLNDIPTSLPRVRSVVWFHQNKEQDWRVNSSANSLAAYKQVVADPSWQGTMP